MSSYLKRAALSRLNARLVNKKEELACGLRRFTIHVEDLESSTLSDVEKHHVNRWSQGTESGRMCLLALLDHRRALQAISGSDATEEKQGVGEGAAGGGGVEFALLSSSINLPEEFLCNSSYLYQRVFSKPPVAVIREALELLKEKAHEQSIESLDVDQINMALKQIRVDNLAQAAVAWEKADNEESKDADQENRGRGNSEEATPLTHTARVKSRLRRVRDEELRLQIIVELIRQHILATNPVDPICGSPIEVPRLPENIAVAELHSHLAVPLERQEKRALTMPPDALERSNLLLKPYIHQLAALRSTLQAQLRELEENAAFFSLGLDNGCNASDAQIKRAYHTLAVRLHPDKPGGDTAKFQKLQDAYQEVLKKKKEKDAQQAAMKGHLADGGDAAGAQHIVEVVAAGIAVVRQAAAQTTTLAQKNIRLMKDIEAAASTVMVGADGVSNSVHAIKLLQALLTEGAADDGQGDGDGDGDGDDDDDSLSRWLREMDAKEPKLSVDEVDSTTATQDKPPPVKVTPRHDLAALSPKHAAAPLEAICEHLQLIAARSMELPACGSRYASATARSPAFIENVEKCMATGLASLKTSGSLGVADAQVSSSVLRLQFAPLLSKTKKTKTKNKTKTTSEGGSKKSRSKFLYDDSDGSSDGIEDFMLSDSDSEFDEEEEEGESEEEEFRGILIEMVLTAFRSASVTINIAAERAIAAVVTATDLHMALVDIVNNADKDRHDEARRKADVEEAESQFCAEDREMMREMKSKAAAEDKVKVRQMMLLLLLFSPLLSYSRTNPTQPVFLAPPFFLHIERRCSCPGQSRGGQEAQTRGRGRRSRPFGHGCSGPPQVADSESAGAAPPAARQIAARAQHRGAWPASAALGSFAVFSYGRGCRRRYAPGRLRCRNWWEPPAGQTGHSRGVCRHCISRRRTRGFELRRAATRAHVSRRVGRERRATGHPRAPGLDGNGHTAHARR